MAGVLASVGLQTVVTDTPQSWLRALRYERAGETYVMLVNEHPHECIDCTAKLAQGERLCGTRLDLLNGTDPVAFDGTLELAPFESCFVALETNGKLESGDGADMGSGDALAIDINGRRRSPSPLPAAEPLAPRRNSSTCAISRPSDSPMHAGRSAIARCSSWRTTLPMPQSTWEMSTKSRRLRSTDTHSAHASVRPIALPSTRLLPARTNSPSTSSTRSIMRFPTSSPSPNPSPRAASSVRYPLRAKPAKINLSLFGRFVECGSSHGYQTQDFRGTGLYPYRATARHLAAMGEDVRGLSIKEFAARTNVSVASVHRFCKKLGLEGFKDLKVELIRQATEAGNRRDVDINFPFDATSTPAQVMERMEGLYQDHAGRNAGAARPRTARLRRQARRETPDRSTSTRARTTSIQRECSTIVCFPPVSARRATAAWRAGAHGAHLGPRPCGDRHFLQRPCPQLQGNLADPQ